MEIGFRGELRERAVAFAGRDERFAVVVLTASARRAVEAWSAAVAGGDVGALHAISREGGAEKLLIRAPRDVSVGDPAIVRLDEQILVISFEVSEGGAEPQFEQSIVLTPDDALPWPWRIAGGFTVQTESSRRTRFASRRETPAEYRERVGAEPPQRARAVRRFRLDANFLEDDNRINDHAVLVIERERAPTLEDAERLLWPAVFHALGSSPELDEYWPRYVSIEARELLD